MEAIGVVDPFDEGADAGVGVGEIGVGAIAGMKTKGNWPVLKAESTWTITRSCTIYLLLRRSR